MKILKWGSLSIHDNSPWIPGKWRMAKDAPKDGKPCGIGFHSLICGDPLKAPVFFFPCEVWEDECQGECGRDEIKARYRRQRIVKEITGQFPIIVAINDFITKTIPAVKWFIPQPPEAWMEVVDYDNLDAAWDAAWGAAWDVLAILVQDLKVDTTWPIRWWRAWELGYYPIKEDGVKLVVGKINSFCA